MAAVHSTGARRALRNRTLPAKPRLAALPMPDEKFRRVAFATDAEYPGLIGQLLALHRELPSIRYDAGRLCHVLDVDEETRSDILDRLDITNNALLQLVKVLGKVLAERNGEAPLILDDDDITCIGNALIGFAQIVTEIRRVATEISGAEPAEASNA